jgi:glycosyltransferase involved in cell wall biosynthesis
VTRVDLVDPAFFTPPYDHALASALARAGAEVRVVASHFAHGDVPPPEGYTRIEPFYRRAGRVSDPKLRRYLKAAEHPADMARFRRLSASADVVHFQWAPVPAIDRWLLPRKPVVLTAHDLLPRNPYPGQLRAQQALLRRLDAVIVHSEYGRRQLLDGIDLDPAAVHVVRHGAFDYLTRLPAERPLDPQLQSDKPVVLFFGLLRPYKGIDVLLDAWRALSADAELWIVGRAMMDTEPLRRTAPPSVRFVTRFVDEAEVPALFRRADIVVVPYVQTERYDFSGVLATALAFGKPTIASDVGGFREVAQAGAAKLVKPGDADGLARAINHLLKEPGARAELAAGAAAAAAGEYSWDRAAARTLEVYESVRNRR